MADYRNLNGRLATTGVRTEADIDEGLRAYMLRVYNYMTLALAITGLAALGTNVLATSNPAFAQLIYVSPLKWVIMFAPLALVFFLSFKVQTMSVGAAQLTFWIYSALVGLSLSSIFLVFTGRKHHADLLRDGCRLRRAVSLYGYTTKRDLTAHGLVPDHGRVRPHHRDDRQHLPAVLGARLRHLGDRRADLRRPHRLRHAEDQGDV